MLDRERERERECEEECGPVCVHERAKARHNQKELDKEIHTPLPESLTTRGRTIYAYLPSTYPPLLTSIVPLLSHRIDTQILPSGQMPLETARTNGAGYCIYNLDAFTHVAALAEYAGVNVRSW